MESFAVAVAETFEFMQPFCSAAMRKQAAFASAPLKNAGSNHTLATETDMTAEHHHHHHHDDEVYPHKQASSVAQQRVHYLQERCDTSLTSSLSEDEMLLPYDPSFYANTSSSLVGTSNYYHYYYAGDRPVPTQVTFFTPKQRTAPVELSSRLSIQWHVHRAAGGFKGVDEWTGKLLEPAFVDARQDTGEECLGYVTCFRVSPTFQLPVTAQEHQALALVHPHLAALAQYMHANTTLTNTHTTTTAGGAMTRSSSSLSASASASSSQDNKPLFGLPLVLITHVQVSTEYRGMGIGLLLVDETCRCLANPAQWVLLGTTEQSLREYFGLLGFTGSGLLDGQVIVRWNDPYCMATHRYEDLCPHLPRVVIQ